MKKKLLVLLLFIFGCSVYAQDKEFKELMAQDWPNLEKYRQDNERIKNSGDYPKVVFMGNSITELWVDKDAEFFKKHNYLGRGISGQTTPQMLIRFMPEVVDLKPEVVVILAGTNDISGATGKSSVKMITDNIKAMTQLAKANGIKVLLCSILPVKQYPWRKQIKNPTKTIKKVNKWMKDYAKKQQVYYLDYYSEMTDGKKGMKEGLSFDGVHPTVKGYEVMEPLVVSKIQSILTRK